MSFWAEKVREINPPPVRQPQQAVSEGPWWQTAQPARPTTSNPRPVPQPVQAVPQRVSVPGYAPVTADVTSAEIDLCPRCGSDDYASLRLLPNPGGQPVMGQAKQCFSCRYPAPNATGELVTAGFGGNVENIETHVTKYAAGPRTQAANPKVGSWSQVSTGEALGNTPVIR